MKFQSLDKAIVTRFSKWLSEGEIVTIVNYIGKGVYAVLDTDDETWHIHSKALTFLK